MNYEIIGLGIFLIGFALGAIIEYHYGKHKQEYYEHYEVDGISDENEAF